MTNPTTDYTSEEFAKASQAMNGISAAIRNMVSELIEAGVPPYLVLGGISVGMAQCAEAIGLDVEEFKGRIAQDIDMIYSLARVTQTQQ